MHFPKFRYILSFILQIHFSHSLLMMKNQYSSKTRIESELLFEELGKFPIHMPLKSSNHAFQKNIQTISKNSPRWMSLVY